MLSYIQIETAPNPTASIIWLHGLGADGHDFEPIIPELNLPPTMALYVGTHQQEALAGILALSCYTLLPDDAPHAAAKVTPIMQMHGLDDEVVPYFLGEESRNFLIESGFKVDYRSYPMPHSLHPKQIMDIGNWITHLLGRLSDLVGRN